MIVINFQNVEELVFYDKMVQQLFPEWKDTFQTWVIGKRVAPLAHLAKKAVLEVLENLTGEFLDRLGNHFSDTITIEKTDSSLVHHCLMPLTEAAELLNEEPYYSNNFVVCRDESNLYLDFWR